MFLRICTKLFLIWKRFGWPSVTSIPKTYSVWTAFQLSLKKLLFEITIFWWRFFLFLHNLSSSNVPHLFKGRSSIFHLFSDQVFGIQRWFSLRRSADFQLIWWTVASWSFWGLLPVYFMSKLLFSTVYIPIHSDSAILLITVLLMTLQSNR